MLTRRLIGMRPILAVLVLLASGALAERASAFETPARAAILIDLQSDQVLYAKNPDEPLPPASMSKLMTAFMVFEQLEEGRLSLDDTFPVSEKAWRKGGSKMFVEVGSRVRVEDLLRGIIVQSGNDACIVVAEALAESEEAFAARMTARARELGLTHTTLKNASGWPDPEHLMSVRDLATLAQTLIERFPNYYTLYSEKEFTFNGIRQYSRNPLLHRTAGADGLKTGYTEEAGYGLTASAVRDGRRLVLVLAGLERAGDRAREAERLLEYGYRQFKSYQLFSAGEAVGKAGVWLGSEATVPLVLERDVVISLTPEGRRDLEVKVVYDGPIPAPVVKGAQVAELEIVAPGIEPRRLPLIASEEVQAANLLSRVTSALGYLIWGPS
ncbi:MAG TPA: D-alanyl-D-alanine carboxypeptidase family protein [Geminicoccaceae bacterium]|nr:D-alanyl-D-alanine carboxypeptidase family protein [Geminicoccaceae bacterium]